MSAYGRVVARRGRGPGMSAAVGALRAALAPEPRDLRRALLAAGAVLGLMALVALATAVGFPGPARHALGFGFGGVPPRLGEAVSIFLHNAKMMAAIAAATIVVQAPRLERPEAPLGRGGRALRGVCDAGLALAIAWNVVVVGASVGAYGERMVRAMLPHGPVELAAFAFALAVYARARTTPLLTAPPLRPAAWALGLLALAALLETFAAV